MQSIIETLYEEIYQTQEYAEAQMKHRKDYDTAYQRFVHSDEDETAFIMANTEQEQFGFIQGFKYAMRLKKGV